MVESAMDELNELPKELEQIIKYVEQEHDSPGNSQESDVEDEWMMKMPKTNLLKHQMTGNEITFTFLWTRLSIH